MVKYRLYFLLDCMLKAYSLRVSYFLVLTIHINEKRHEIITYASLIVKYDYKAEKKCSLSKGIGSYGEAAANTILIDNRDAKTTGIVSNKMYLFLRI